MWSFPSSREFTGRLYNHVTSYRIRFLGLGLADASRFILSLSAVNEQVAETIRTSW